MAKPEIMFIHPKSAADALHGFTTDAWGLLAAAKHAASFMDDESLDPEAVIKAVMPMLRPAIEKLERWRSA